MLSTLRLPEHSLTSLKAEDPFLRCMCSCDILECWLGSSLGYGGREQWECPKFDPKFGTYFSSDPCEICKHLNFK